MEGSGTYCSSFVVSLKYVRKSHANEMKDLIY